MDRFGMLKVCALALGLGITFSVFAGEKSEDSDKKCRVYSLAEWGNTRETASMGKWLAKTIPTVIDPDAWQDSNLVSYHSGSQILIVYQSDRVQAKVATFLKQVKKNLPHNHSARGNGGFRESVPANTCLSPVSVNMVPARFEPAVPSTSVALPTPLETPQVASQVSTATPGNNIPGTREFSEAYPVPAQKKAPKHLFHFIIRYEGEGIVDDNVVKAIKYSYADENANKASNNNPSSATAISPSVGAESSTRSEDTTPANDPSTQASDENEETPIPRKSKTKVNTPAINSPVYVTPTPPASAYLPPTPPIAAVATLPPVSALSPERIAAPSIVPDSPTPARKTRKVVKNKKIS